MRLLPLLILLSACATQAGNCRAAQAVYYAMVGGGAPAGSLELARQDVGELCRD